MQWLFRAGPHICEPNLKSAVCIGWLAAFAAPEEEDEEEEGPGWWEVPRHEREVSMHTCSTHAL